MSIISAIIKHIQGSLTTPATVENGQWCVNVDESGGGTDLTELVLKDNSGIDHVLVMEPNIDSKISTAVSNINQSIFFIANNQTEFKDLMESSSDISIIANGFTVTDIEYTLIVSSNKKVYINGRNGIIVPATGMSISYPTSNATNDINIEFFGIWDTSSGGDISVGGGYSGNPYNYSVFFENIESNITDNSSGYVDIDYIETKNSLNIAGLIKGDPSAKQAIIDGLLSVGNSSPKDWNSSYGPLQLGGQGAISATKSASGDGTLYITDHLYRDPSSWKFLGTDSYHGAAYSLNRGAHYWYSTTDAGVDGASATISEKMRLTNTGQLLIGTSAIPASVSYKQVLFDSGTAVFTLYQTTTSGTGNDQGTQIGHDDTAGATIWNYENTGLRFGTNGTRRGGFSASGDFDINGDKFVVTGSNGNTTIAGTLDVIGSLEAGSIETGTIIVKNIPIKDSGGALRSYITTNGSDTTIELSSGSFLVAPWNGSIYATKFKTSTSGNTLYSTTTLPDISTSGTGNPVYVTASGVLWENTSSRRFKMNERAMELNTPSLFQLEVATYERKTIEKVKDKDGNETGEEIEVAVATENGWIAEEVYKINPDFCTYDKDGVTPRGVHRDNIMVAMFEEMKKMRAELDALKAVN